MNKHLKNCLWVGFSLLLLTSLALPSHASYQCLRLDGSGWAEISDASQAGLDMGLSDFMIEARVKTSYSADHQKIVSKRSNILGYEVYIFNTGSFMFFIGDGTDYITPGSATPGWNDGRWHYIAVVADRDGNVYFYIDGDADGSTNISSYSSASLDNDAVFNVGILSTVSYPFCGLTDEVRIWNFGYGGLPTQEDYEAYITWRAQGRNVFKDVSEYNSGSWNCYADADRTEKVTDPGIENWTDDTPDDWTEWQESAGVRDIVKETTTVHGGSAAVKLQATDNDGEVDFRIGQILTLSANKYYEAIWWTKFVARTQGIMRCLVHNVTDGEILAINILATETAYTIHRGIFKPTVIESEIYLYSIDETTGNGLGDDISVKRVGLVARWSFESDYSDSTSNSNTLTEDGTGNTFPGYTLKKEKIISPSWVR